MANVQQVMNREVITCDLDDSLDLVAQRMWDGDVGCLPVIDDRRSVVGMITDRDVCMAAYTRGLRLAEIRVGDVMSRKVVSCSADEDLAAVEWRMAVAQVRRVPVVDSRGALIGIVSMNDLARKASSLHDEAAFVDAMAHVCEPRRRTALVTAS
jgi:CBS domain-containing protein